MPFRIRAHYIYWFVGNGITTAHHYERYLINWRDNLLHGKNHRWAYPSVMAFVSEDIGRISDRDSESTQQMLIDFIRAIVPEIQKDFRAPHSEGNADEPRK